MLKENQYFEGFCRIKVGSGQGDYVVGFSRGIIQSRLDYGSLVYNFAFKLIKINWT